jgi:hypothetical protein
VRAHPLPCPCGHPMHKMNYPISYYNCKACKRRGVAYSCDRAQNYSYYNSPCWQYVLLHASSGSDWPIYI